MNYFAHSENLENSKDTLNAHLTATGEMCSNALAPINLSQTGKLLGNIHDFGKYSTRMQRVIRKNQGRVNHALPSAATIMMAYRKENETTKILAAVVASHHCVLSSYSTYETEIASLINALNVDRKTDEENRDFALSTEKEFAKALRAWGKDFSFPQSLPDLQDFITPETPKLSKMLLMRFLFSALVDSDWTCTAEHFHPDEQGNSKPEELDASIVEAGRDYLKDKFNPEYRCKFSVDNNIEMFTLTAPAGNERVYSALDFALNCCTEKGRRRIVFALESDDSTINDFTVYLNNVSNNKEKLNSIQEQRWNSPCIVTTTKLFLEALFSNEAAVCRNLHQIINSVIVIEGLQNIPFKLLIVTLQSLCLLTKIYKCTVVLVSSTHPEFQMIDGINWKAKEINSYAIYESPTASLPEKKEDWSIVETEIANAEAILRKRYGGNIDWNDKKIREEYYRILYNGIDCKSKKLDFAIQSENFAEVARLYRMPEVVS